MNKISFEQAQKLSKWLDKKTYFTNPFFILRNCFENKGYVFETGLVNSVHPLLVYSEKYEDVSNKIINTGFDEDIPLIGKKYNILKKELLGIEFFYSSSEWINLEGGKFKEIRKAIFKFEKEHSFKAFDSYPADKVVAFLQEWAEGKRKKETSKDTKELFEHELEESLQNLRLLDNFKLKAIFIEEENILIGFCVFFHFVDNLWVALMQKTKHGVRGLPQYLYHLKSKGMGEGQIYTSGAEALDPNLKKFKESLNPKEVRNIYTIFIGSKL